MARTWPYVHIFFSFVTILRILFWIYVQNRFLFRAMSKKTRVHVTLPGPISNGLEALASLEGRSVSDIVEELSRKRLTEVGALPTITAEDIATEIRKRRKRNG